jgi:hypothetical protein
LLVPKPLDGNYVLRITRVAAGPASVNVKRYSRDRNLPLSSEDISIALSVGQSMTTRVVYTSVVGDVNGDGSVNCGDMSLVKSAIGKRLSQIGFDARADVTLDGVIDVRDLAYVSQRLPVGAICR